MIENTTVIHFLQTTLRRDLPAIKFKYENTRMRTQHKDLILFEP